VPGFVIAVFLALFASAAAQALTSVNQASPTAQKPLPAIQRQKDTLVVGSEQDYPPFATGMSDATAGGFTVDLWKAVAAETGLNYTIHVRPFHQLLREFKEGKIDVLINLAQSDERRQFADFTVPHVIVHGAIFVRKGESNIRSEDDLAGKTIIVLNADLAHDYAVSKGWEKQLVQLDTSAEGLRLLASGKHDAMLLSKLPGMQMLQALGLTNIEVLKVKAGFSQKFAFAVQKGQSELLAKVNEGLALTKSNGTYDALYEKWFGVYEVKEAGLRDVLKYIILIVVSFLLIGAYFFYRRQVERKQAEAALRESEESLSITLNSIGDAVLATDTEGRVARMNPVAERLTGWPFAEAQGRPVGEVFRIVNEQTRAHLVVPVAEVLETGEVQGPANHTVLIARDNAERPIANNAAPIRDAGGRLSGVVLVFRDITERKAVEEQLRDSTTRIRVILDTVADGIITSDERGIVETLNPAAERIFGYAASEVIGRNVKMLMPEPYHGEHDGYLERYRTTGEARVIGIGREFVGQRKDGSTFALDLAVSEMRPGGERHYTGIVRDITERKRIAETLRVQSEEIARKNVELEEANRAKSDFLANMSHELRTPLNSIIGFSEMLKDGVLGELDAKQRGFVADIFDAGTHLLSLINDILDLSKVEAGMLQLEAGAVDVAALLRASTLVVREKALTHRIRLVTELDPGLGTLLADERKLKQIVYNLLSNAVKFTPEGGAVTLSARRCARAEVTLDAALPGRLIALPPGEHNEFLAVTVEDTGVGIAEEHLPKLFEPFMQVDSSVSRRHAGTGLGLSLVRRLAELHGGTVGVASRPGVGSRFCVWLPYRTAAPAAQEGRTMPEGTAPSVPLALVIEDDDRMADLIAAQLRAEGFEVMRAATAEEGLVRAAKRKPELITLDMFLPAMDGWEFMRRLRADPKLADTPVVIITVSEDLDHGLALGARRVLHKPFVREELVAALAGLLDARPGGEPARVLVVDDNVKAVELVATALEAEGYRVMRAYGGAEAIEVARSARPDLVILDLMMPEVSGFEVARALRESEHTARIPILVLTAKDLSAEGHARLNGDLSAILAKASFSTSDLLAELRRALPKRAGD
jgi:PAS domain S-box-containing protein